MLTLVAAVKAPNKHDRRRVTGSSGRMREGSESERQRPHMSRRVFASAVLLLFVLCCDRGAATAQVENNADASTSGPALTGTITAEGSASGGVEVPQGVDLFVPQTTQVLPKKGTTESGRRDSFVSPSLVSAGGVIAAFAEGHINAKKPPTESTKPFSDVVAEYIDSAWEWSTLVEEVKKKEWSAHTVLGKAEGKEGFDVVRHPTTIAKGDKVFLLAGSTALSYVNGSWEEGSLELKLVVGDVTKPTGGEPREWIKWDEVQSPMQLTTSASHEGNLTDYIASGGSGVLMEDGTIVFSLMAMNKENEVDVYSMIIYSKDNGSTWSLSKGMSPAKCGAPRVTEWEGSLLMIIDCESSQRVYESRDMGKTWTEAIGTLPGVWVNSQSEDYPEGGLHVDALITATIEEGRKVMLYIQRGYAMEENANPLYLWVTDNNRSFFVGPVGKDNAGEKEVASSLLYSDGNLHLLQRRASGEGSVISLSHLAEELSTIKSVLKTWAQNDAFFSNLSIPTAGLVAVLSNASASDDTWNDEYLCLNATVRNAVKVNDGFQLTEPNSGILWLVNIPGDNVRHVSLSHNFTLVASVTIEETPSEKTPLLNAVLVDAGLEHLMRLSYTADSKWETMLKDETKPTTGSRPWEPKKEHQVALMLQGKKRSVYVDGELLGEEEVPLKSEKPPELFAFCFGACGEDDDEEVKSSPKEIGKKSLVTVTNVFLYNRPLNPTERTAIKDRKPVPKRAPEPQVKITPQPVAPAGPAGPAVPAGPAGPAVPAGPAGPAVPAGPAGPAVPAGNEGTAREKGDGGANGDAGSAYGRELLPLLLLLGLWGLATA
ncbi:putative trans-sialidase, Group II [Trypanosoma cruzi]|nr:putative trans-sialidase, Group II [Trypanosoma cruzi]